MRCNVIRLLLPLFAVALTPGFSAAQALTSLDWPSMLREEAKSTEGTTTPAVADTTRSRSKAPFAGALLGGGLGAVVGLVVYEGLADIEAPCTAVFVGGECIESQSGPSRLQAVLIFGVIGALVGLGIGSAVARGAVSQESGLHILVDTYPPAKTMLGVRYRF